MENKPVQLKDIISYTPETYFSEEEISLIRSSFSGPQGAKLLKAVRKALMPTISDPDLPVEEMAKDLFMAAVDFSKMEESQVKPIAMGLQLSMKVIAGSLMNLKNIANVDEESPQQKAARIAKDSAK